MSAYDELRSIGFIHRGESPTGDQSLYHILVFAMKHGSEELVYEALNNGAKLRASMVLFICWGGNMNLLKLIDPIDERPPQYWNSLLIRKPIDWNEGLKGGAVNGSISIMEEMIRRGATNIKAAFNDACAVGNFDAARWLETQGGIEVAERRVMKNGGRCLLTNSRVALIAWLTARGQSEVVDLLETDGKVDYLEGLHRACENGQAEMVKYLLPLLSERCITVVRGRLYFSIGLGGSLPVFNLFPLPNEEEVQKLLFGIAINDRPALLDTVIERCKLGRNDVGVVERYKSAEKCHELLEKMEWTDIIAKGTAGEDGKGMSHSLDCPE